METAEGIAQSKDIVVITDEEKATWEIQKDHLVELGFHKVLGMTEQDYRDSLPNFQSQPIDFKHRFDIPILVDPRISLRRQFKLLKIGGYYATRSINPVNIENIEGLETPETPYQIWTNEGTRFKEISEMGARKNFATDERGLTIIEGLGLIRERPFILQEHPIDLASSERVGGSGTDRVRYGALRLGKSAAKSYRALLNRFNEFQKPGSVTFPTCGLPIAV